MNFKRIFLKLKWTIFFVKPLFHLRLYINHQLGNHCFRSNATQTPSYSSARCSLQFVWATRALKPYTHAGHFVWLLRRAASRKCLPTTIRGHRSSIVLDSQTTTVFVYRQVSQIGIKRTSWQLRRGRERQQLVLPLQLQLLLKRSHRKQQRFRRKTHQRIALIDQQLLQTVWSISPETKTPAMVVKTMNSVWRESSNSIAMLI